MFAQKQKKRGKELPIGDAFLPDVGAEYILKKIKKIQSGKPRDIMMACYYRKTGESLREIVRLMVRQWSTIRNWLLRIMERGLKGMYDKKSTGRKRILGNSDLKQIKRWVYRDPAVYGFESASWHIDMVYETVKRIIGKFNCSLRTLRRGLREQGLTYSKPRQIPHQSASHEEQEKFKNEVQEEIARLKGLRYRAISVGEVGSIGGIRRRIRVASKRRLHSRCQVQDQVGQIFWRARGGQNPHDER